MTSPTHPSHPPTVHLTTTPVTFALWWLALFVLYVVNIAYYVGAAFLYHSMRYTNVDFQLTTFVIGIKSTEWHKISIIHGIIAALHGLFLMGMLVGSIQARRLVFRPTLSPWVSTLLDRISSSSTNSIVPSSPHVFKRLVGSELNVVAQRVSTFSDYSIAFTSSVFGQNGLLGVNGFYFDHVFLLREIIETTLQVIQVYRMSYLLPRIWLIRFYVVLLVLNCWSTPLVHRIYHNRHTQRRMVSLLCDAILDMVSSIGVSFVIFTTYAPQYTDPAFGFPFNNWFDDVWFTNMQQEFQMMMVVSWADLAARLFFALGLLQCMNSIQAILTSRIVKVSANVNSTTIVPVGNPVETSQAPTIVHLPTSTWWSRLIRFILETAAPRFFLLLGMGILIIHVVSETRTASSAIPCKLQVHPWFVAKPACSLVELDCHRLGGLSGSQESMHHAWEMFEFSATARVFVRHCPLLEVPATIRQFRQMTTIKIYNCTIASWSDTAGLTAADHPNMRALFFIRTMFSNGELPAGLLSSQFPPGLSNFVTSVTNLQHLPDNLHEHWPLGMALSFENSQLTSVPPTLLKMSAAMFSFAGSPISTIPPETFESPVLCCVVLTQTLITELPSIVNQPSPGLYLLFVDGTNVSTFWAWMEPFIHLSLWISSDFFSAQGTRYCVEREEIVAGNRTNFTLPADSDDHDLASVMDVSTPAKLEFARSAVTCDADYPYYFPLDLQDMTTALHDN